MTLLEETRLSTAPAPVPPRPGGRSFRTTLRRGWRQLTSMRTALLLLFLLALAAVPGSFLPQRGLNPLQVQDYIKAHPDLAPWLDRLSLFDVFAAPWFAAVYLLLFVSLIGCLGPRIRLHARALRAAPPRVPAVLSRLPVSDSWQTTQPPEEVVDVAEKALRAARWRVVRREGALSAEKGYLRETGNLLFHLSLVGLLIGIALGGIFGFKGTVLVKEGEGFASAILNYDDISPGRRFAPDRLVPFHLRLKDFRATYRDSGEALTFAADIDWAPGPDAETRPYTVRVNHPLSSGGAKAYLIGHGYSVQVRVRDAAGQVALQEAVPCLPQNPQFLSSCVIKVPDPSTGQQFAFEGVFTPTTVQDPVTRRVGSLHPAPDLPVLTVVGFRGDLGIDSGTPGSVYQLDTSRLTPMGAGAAQQLAPGDTWRLPGGGELTLVGVEEWATFQVTQDPGKLIALLAGMGMVAGLCLSLSVRRRRFWLRALPPGQGPDLGSTVVQAGGLSRSDSEAFAREFHALTHVLRPPTAIDPDHGKA
ncbi:MAG TPA: cytochrome c biogenesis protein ResB [Mycobacteriales bacterium]|nr:cytochrome c biogenesis protein ResB [Mycobacteriales bacterium]